MSYLQTKPGSLEEAIKRNDEDYQAMFKKELKKTGKSIPQMTPDEKKKFFNKIDKMHAAKNEAKVDELTKAQEKLPPALQKAIKKKEMKEEQIDEREKGIDQLPRQFLNPSKEVMIVKKGKVIVIDKKDQDKYMRQGWDLAEYVKSDGGHRRVKEGDQRLKANKINEEEGMTQKGKNKVASLKTKLDKEKDTDALEAQITDLKGQIALLKTQLENEKNSTVKPEPNPETGEVPLTVGVAYKHLRDKMKKEEEKKDSKKTAVGSKANKVDTKPEVEFDK